MTAIPATRSCPRLAGLDRQPILRVAPNTAATVEIVQLWNSVSASGRARLKFVFREHDKTPDPMSIQPVRVGKKNSEYRKPADSRNTRYCMSAFLATTSSTGIRPSCIVVDLPRSPYVASWTFNKLLISPVSQSYSVRRFSVTDCLCPEESQILCLRTKALISNTIKDVISVVNY